MAENRKARRNKNREKEKIEEIETADFGGVIKLLIAIVIIVVAFYLLTIMILNKKTTKYTNNASIQYSKILAGETFTKKDKEYYVFFYKLSDEKSAEYAEVISKYRENKDSKKMYTVDMDEGLNKKYNSEEENRDATKASELKINGATLIYIKDGKVVDYITEDFANYLNVEIKEDSEKE